MSNLRISLTILLVVSLANLATLATPTDEEGVCFVNLGNFIESVQVPAEVEELANIVREANPKLSGIPLVKLVNNKEANRDIRHLLKSDISAVKNTCTFYVYNILQKISLSPCGIKLIRASYDDGDAIVSSHPVIEKVLGYVAACELVQQ